MKAKQFILILLAMLGAMSVTFTSCSDSVSSEVPESGYADLVVYGNVFTSAGNNMAEAFAVKDGKYIAVGNREDIQKYISKETEVIDHTGKGMVMAGCTEGHGHYLMSNFYKYGNYVIEMTPQDTKETILSAIEAKAAGNPDYIFGFGFDYNALKEDGKYPTRQEMDEKIKNVPIYLQDSEGHKGLANTYCLMQSGILNPDGTVKSDFKYKHYVKVDAEGMPTGMLLEQAGTYVRVHGCTPTDGPEVWQTCAKAAQDELNSMGYTAAVEGWANKFGMVTYDVISDMDKSGELTLNFGMAYEIENLSTEEVARELNAAVMARDKYSSERVHTNYIKLFEDGTPESGTGYMLEPNAGGSCGNPIWEAEELRNLTLAANNMGLAMHIHAMGDAAVKAVVDAYSSVGNTGKPANVRNQIVHLRNVDEADYKRMAENDIVASCGVLWHSFYPESLVKANLSYLTKLMAEKYWYEGYPYQSFLNHKVHTSISTDAPASSGAPTDPFGIMEIAVTGKQDFYGSKTYTTPWDTKECVRDRADFLRSLTIEGAYQMGTEQTRGSIAVGKYADFILIDQDVLECPATELHETTVLKTFFEGKCVFEKKQ